eukprot:TRINITY_DN2760_c0_g1_i2.p1 TRINITY_DN2760_c0_g1~~TRINITY_DN2760_c0_g1_i2.p1  ORF type:complete len:449 (-),score=119.78 TRINITY_DN2760_c0_g1_i2:18-1364(-)
MTEHMDPDIEDLEDDSYPHIDLQSSLFRPKLPRVAKRRISFEDRVEKSVMDIGVAIQKTVPKLLDKHNEPSPTSNIPSTSILEGLGGELGEVEEKKAKSFTTRKYEVDLKDGRKTKLKVFETTFNREDNICAMFCEFYLGRSLSHITGAVNLPLDIRAFKAPNAVHMELLTESGGTPLRKYWSKLATGEGVWIAYQIVDSLVALSDVLMGHIALSPETIEIGGKDSKVKFSTEMLVPLYQAHKVNNEILLWSLAQLKGNGDEYAAPELRKEYGTVSEILVEKAEVYTCCLLLCGLLQNEMGLEVDEDVYQSSLDFIRGPMLKVLPKERLMEENPELAKFMEQCLHKNPVKRPALHQLKHMLFREVEKLRPGYKKRQSMVVLFDYKIMARTFESLGKHFIAMKYYRAMCTTIKRRIKQNQYDLNKELAAIYTKLAVSYTHLTLPTNREV